jgi:hypothetical protein
VPPSEYRRTTATHGTTPASKAPQQSKE